MSCNSIVVFIVLAMIPVVYHHIYEPDDPFATWFQCSSEIFKFNMNKDVPTIFINKLFSPNWFVLTNSQGNIRLIFMWIITSNRGTQ